MARYFKYKTAKALVDDALSRGLEVQLDEDLGPLLQPLTIHGRTLGNRMAIHPMEGCDGTADGHVGDLTIRRYQRFGAGGAKLIWGEAVAVVPEGRANPRQLVMSARHADGLKQLLGECRQAHHGVFGRDDDMLVGIQLTHSGRYSQPTPIRAHRDPLLDPRTILDKSTGRVAGPDDPLISDDELDSLQERYLDAARLAFAIGFDFIDIKQCHRYLLCELLSARSRQGRYGGSFENRTRFIRTLFERLHAEFPGKLLATRLNLYDGVPFQKGAETDDGVPSPFVLPIDCCWGVDSADPSRADLEEPLRLIGLLKELGVGLVNVSMGNPYANPHFGRPFEYVPVDGYQPPEHPLIGVDRHFRLTATIQRQFPDLAIVGTGYSWLQEFAMQAGAANLRDGRVSVVGIGRAALSNPDFARQVIEGRPLEPKRTCRTFSYCTALMRSKHNELGQYPTGCPPFDKGVYDPIWKEAQRTAPERPAP